MSDKVTQYCASLDGHQTVLFARANRIEQEKNKQFTNYCGYLKQSEANSTDNYHKTN